MLEKGKRVRVKETGQVGTVVYVRMGPPTYSTVEVASVKLDGRDHVGAIFAAEKLEEI